jgi:hypothetical protein
MPIDITAEEAGKMVDYFDKRYAELQRKKKELDLEIAINREMRDRYRDLWFSLSKEIKK